MKGAKKRKGGWPARTPEPGERVPMSFRVTPELKGGLDKAAAHNGRSLSQEIEMRLDLSFRDLDAFDRAAELVYGRRIAGLLMLLGRVMRDAGTHGAHLSTGAVDADWLANPYAFDQVAKGVAAALGAFRPAGDPAKPAFDVAVPLDRLGELLAIGAIEAIKNPERGGEIGEWARQVREKLGTAVDQITADTSMIAVSAAPGIIATMGKGKRQ